VPIKESKLYMARVQVVEAMEQGLLWHEAAKRAGLPISQLTTYRLRQRMWEADEQAMREGRHGHPSNCEVRCGRFWKRHVGKLLTRQVTRSK
jgi:hypothetical protein